MSPVAQALNDAILDVHHVQGMPTDKQFTRLYGRLVVAVSNDDRAALTLAKIRLRDARDHWAGTSAKTRTLTDLSPTIAPVVYALDCAYVFAAVAHSRALTASLAGGEDWPEVRS